jgi:hypothetical protein
MRNLVYFITIIAISAYFSATYYATTITIEGLESEYHYGDEIKFAATVRGFGDAVPAYSVEFQSLDYPGMGIAGNYVMDGTSTTYLNFPLPFEKTINYSHIVNSQDDKLGQYIMKFRTLGHTLEKKVTLVP